MPEQLRQLASMLRKQAEVEQGRIDVKCAQAVQAAAGLQALKTKLGLK